MAKKPKQPVYLNPNGKNADFDFGVLRAEFNGRPNSIAAFAREKARVATRNEILLPPDAPDGLIDPDAHWSDYERNLLPAQRDLGTLVTLYFPEARTLHGVFEEVRSFAAAFFAAEHRLSTHVHLHAPTFAGSRNCVHAHLVISARQCLPWGWGAFTTFVRDAGQPLIFEAWTEHRQKKRGLDLSL